MLEWINNHLIIVTIQKNIYSVYSSIHWIDSLKFFLIKCHAKWSYDKINRTVKLICQLKNYLSARMELHEFTSSIFISSM